MSLSSIIASMPKHQTVLPISGRKIEFRPFIVKEEKILLMASETKDEKTINSAVREVILSCTSGEVDVFKLPIVDMEYLFLQLRTHSVGETVKPHIKCTKCEIPNEVEINIKEIVPETDPNHKKVIPIVGDISVQMKYPTLNDIGDIQSESDVEKTLSLLAKCIDKVYQGEKIYNTSEMPEKEVREFIDQLTQDQFKKLFSFLDTMPKLQKNIKFKCKSCGTDNDVVLRGITRFFS